MTALLILHYDPQSIYSLLLFNKNHSSSQAHFVENNLLRCQQEKVNPAQYAALKHLSQWNTLKGIKVTERQLSLFSVQHLFYILHCIFPLDEDFAQKREKKSIPKWSMRWWTYQEETVCSHLWRCVY